MVRYSEDIREQEEDGLVDTVLVAVKYTGDKSAKAPLKLKDKAAWPSGSPMYPGIWELGIVPDRATDEISEDDRNRNVVAIERDPQYEITYDPSDIAKALLERNYLPPKAFGLKDGAYDSYLRNKVMDALGVDGLPLDDEEAVRQKLEELAGVESDEEEVKERTREQELVAHYANEYTRAELSDTVEKIIESLDEDDIDSPDKRRKSAMAEWLADRDRTEVDGALQETV